MKWLKRIVIFLLARLGFPGAWIFLMLAALITQIMTDRQHIELLILQSSFLVAYFLSRIVKTLEEIRDKQI